MTLAAGTLGSWYAHRQLTQWKSGQQERLNRELLHEDPLPEAFSKEEANNNAISWAGSLATAIAPYLPNDVNAEVFTQFEANARRVVLEALKEHQKQNTKETKEALATARTKYRSIKAFTRVIELLPDYQTNFDNDNAAFKSWLGDFFREAAQNPTLLEECCAQSINVADFYDARFSSGFKDLQELYQARRIESGHIPSHELSEWLKEQHLRAILQKITALKIDSLTDQKESAHAKQIYEKKIGKEKFGLPYMPEKEYYGHTQVTEADMALAEEAIRLLINGDEEGAKSRLKPLIDAANAGREKRGETPLSEEEKNSWVTQRNFLLANGVSPQIHSVSTDIPGIDRQQKPAQPVDGKVFNALHLSQATINMVRLILKYGSANQVKDLLDVYGRDGVTETKHEIRPRNKACKTGMFKVLALPHAPTPEWLGEDLFTRSVIAGIATYYGAGNCAQHAYLAYCHLIHLGYPGLKISLCNSKIMPHQFVMLEGNDENGKPFQVIVDPWATKAQAVLWEHHNCHGEINKAYEVVSSYTVTEANMGNNPLAESFKALDAEALERLTPNEQIRGMDAEEINKFIKKHAGPNGLIYHEQGRYVTSDGRFQDYSHTYFDELTGKNITQTLSGIQTFRELWTDQPLSPLVDIVTPIGTKIGLNPELQAHQTIISPSESKKKSDTSKQHSTDGTTALTEEKIALQSQQRAQHLTALTEEWQKNQAWGRSLDEMRQAWKVIATKRQQSQTKIDELLNQILHYEEEGIPDLKQELSLLEKDHPKYKHSIEALHQMRADWQKKSSELGHMLWAVLHEMSALDTSFESVAEWCESEYRKQKEYIKKNTFDYFSRRGATYNAERINEFLHTLRQERTVLSESQDSLSLTHSYLNRRMRRQHQLTEDVLKQRASMDNLAQRLGLFTSDPSLLSPGSKLKREKLDSLLAMVQSTRNTINEMRQQMEQPVIPAEQKRMKDRILQMQEENVFEQGREFLQDTIHDDLTEMLASIYRHQEELSRVRQPQDIEWRMQRNTLERRLENAARTISNDLKKIKYSQSLEEFDLIQERSRQHRTDQTHSLQITALKSQILREFAEGLQETKETLQSLPDKIQALDVQPSQRPIAPSQAIQSAKASGNNREASTFGFRKITKTAGQFKWYGKKTDSSAGTLTQSSTQAQPASTELITTTAPELSIIGELSQDDRDFIDRRFGKNFQPTPIPEHEDTLLTAIPLRITNRNTVLYQQLDDHRSSQPSSSHRDQSQNIILYEVTLTRLQAVGRGDRADIEERIRQGTPVHFWVRALTGHTKHFQQISRNAQRYQAQLSASEHRKGTGGLETEDYDAIRHEFKGRKNVHLGGPSLKEPTQIKGVPFHLTGNGIVLYRIDASAVENDPRRRDVIPVSVELLQKLPNRGAINVLLEQIMHKAHVNFEIPPVNSLAGAAKQSQTAAAKKEKFSVKSLFFKRTTSGRR